MRIDGGISARLLSLMRHFFAACSDWLRGTYRRTSGTWRGAIAWAIWALGVLQAIWVYLIKPLWGVIETVSTAEYINEKAPGILAAIKSMDIGAIIYSVVNSWIAGPVMMLASAFVIYSAGKDHPTANTPRDPDVSAPLGDPVKPERATSASSSSSASIRFVVPESSGIFGGLFRNRKERAAREAARQLASEIRSWADMQDQILPLGFMDAFHELEHGGGSFEMGMDFQSRFARKLDLLRPYMTTLATLDFVLSGMDLYQMTPDRARSIASSLESFSYGI